MDDENKVLGADEEAAEDGGLAPGTAKTDDEEDEDEDLDELGAD